METIEDAIARGETMEQDDPDGAIAYFAALAERYPDDGRVIFAYAGAFDTAGQEANAVALYRRARELGLPGELLPRWYVQFGSTLRNVGELQDAVAILQEGHAAYPDDVAIACFVALARHSAGDPGRALRGMIELVLAEAEHGRVDLPRYRRSLAWYAADLTGDTVVE